VRRLVTLLVLVLAGAALVAAPAGAGSKKKTIKLGDNYYAPTKLTVARGTKFTWRWPDEAIDVHDVKLKKGPKGVKKFHSQPASSYYTFKRKLKKPGKYQIICTLHEEMKMTITVRK
jgi:plastocyanin